MQVAVCRAPAHLHRSLSLSRSGRRSVPPEWSFWGNGPSRSVKSRIGSSDDAIWVVRVTRRGRITTRGASKADRTEKREAGGKLATLRHRREQRKEATEASSGPEGESDTGRSERQAC